MRDPELVRLAEVLSAIERMEEQERERALRYLADRFSFPCECCNIADVVGR